MIQFQNTPDLYIFLATTGVVALMAIRGRNLWKQDAGYRWVLRGLGVVAFAGLMDSVVDWILWPPDAFLASTANQELVIVGLLYAPGIVAIGFGLSSWIPKVRALDGEVTLRRENEQKLLQLTEDNRAARSEAERANRAKSEFLAMMSHEIRTPLNGILGMTEVLQGTDLNAKQGDMTEVISDSGQTLLAILNDILDLAKLESGRFQIHTDLVDIGETISSTMKLMLPLARDKNLTLTLEGKVPSELELMSDEGRIRQVLINLVGNAIKFTDTGSVKIQIARTVFESQTVLKISVADTGSGIAKRDMSKLFERFVQIDSSYQRRHGGTGLGLTICKEIITLLGGDIGCNSVEGKGSTFWFTLPLETEVCIQTGESNTLAPTI